MRWQRATAGLLFGLTVLIPAAGIAQPDYLPLVQGREWSYTGSGPVTIDRFLQGERLVGEAQTSVLQNDQAGAIPSVWDNYWTSDAEGRLWLHGFFNYTSGSGLRYEPPILWIDASPQTNDTWSTTTTVHDLETDAVQGAIVVSFEAFVPVSITVPAGTFETLQIDYTVQAASPGRMGPNGPARSPVADLGLLGQPRMSGDSTSLAGNQHWYSDGVGLVRESYPTQINELTSFKTVATNPASFSRVKALFGN